MHTEKSGSLQHTAAVWTVYTRRKEWLRDTQQGGTSTERRAATRERSDIEENKKTMASQMQRKKGELLEQTNVSNAEL